MKLLTWRLLTKLFILSILFFSPFIKETLAQSLPISQAEIESQFKAQLFGNNDINNGDSDSLIQETRFGNLEQLNEPKALAPQDNQAPTFIIAPEIKTLRVGEQKQFTFSFSDAENDAYFGGVVALNTKIELDPGRKPKKQLAREAAINIDVLNSGDASVVLWNITAQNPGVAIFFVSIAELFASNEGGVFKLSSGRIKFVAYAFRVVGENDDSLAPAFLNQFNDTTLKLSERVNLTFAAKSAENRPLTYNFLYLAYASRLIRGRFFGNNAQIKAIDPGQGVFIAFVSDGLKADIQTFIVTVADPKAPPPLEPKLKIRALSTSALVLANKQQPLDIYGDEFSIATQVILKTGSQEQQLPVQFISNNNLRVSMPLNLKEKATLQLFDNNQTTSFDFVPLAPVVVDIKRIRNSSDNVFRLRLLGAEIGRGIKVFANGKELKILDDRTFRSSIVDQIVVILPTELRTQNSIDLKFQGSTGLESPLIRVPLAK
ncbi:MAG: hypothetical protein HY819_03825 [Acidobacteria bacterium]|nr:hypothetical protein [Acidobacteriota bacterium]